LELLDRFRPCFSRPGFRHFARLMVAWILVQGTHTISRLIPLMQRFGLRRHHAAVYRFLSHASWSQAHVGRVLFGLLRPLLSSRVQAIVDDTLCAKSGRQIFGTAIHHDAARSTYRVGRRIEVLTVGHLWVVLAVYVPCPWKADRGWAIPLLFDLYRSPKKCPQHRYKKRSEIALKQLKTLQRWLAPDQTLVATGDAAYCCKTVLSGLCGKTHFVGPLPLNAALHDLVARPARMGRPRRKGYRIANPKTRLQNHSRRTQVNWKQVDVVLYGRTVHVCYATLVCLWYHSAGPSPVRVVLTRDPKSPRGGRAYVSTDPDLGAEEILTTYARRWQLEVTFREIKQELGFEDPRNGWWRRPRGKRDNPCRPAREKKRGQKAVERTAPLAGTAYALTILWYLHAGKRHVDVARVRRYAPWYQHKHDVSFADMRNALRLDIWKTRIPKRIRRIAVNLWCLAGNAA
jgi:hypothetical protein